MEEEGEDNEEHALEVRVWILNKFSLGYSTLAYFTHRDRRDGRSSFISKAKNLLHKEKAFQSLFENSMNGSSKPRR
ncbi:hypothetical protein V6N13_144955 [Hibiscus sabdariffa]